MKTMKTLVPAFIAAITDVNFTDIPLYCEKFFRQVTESVFGTRYAAYYKSSAKLTALAFLHGAGNGTDYIAFTADEIKAHGGLQPGDILFKTEGDGDFGHVGAYVGAVAGRGNDMVAENSATDLGRVRGACGYRSLEDWGHIDVVVRLADPNPAPRLVLAISHASGFIYTAVDSASYDETQGCFTVNEVEVGGILLQGGLPLLCSALLERKPIRDTLAKLGYPHTTFNDLMTAADDPRMYGFIA